MAATIRLSVEPRMLEWACDRSGKPREELREKFPKLDDWITGRALPTQRQLIDFARATYTAFGQLFMPEPPNDDLPIADFRTGPNAAGRPSPHLRDAISECQLRQLWYRDHLIAIGAEPLDWGEAAKGGESPEELAAAIADAAGFDLEERRHDANWTQALRRIVQRLRQSGVLVFISGIVGTNTHRPLDPDEFRGFALSDPLAPLIFVNGSDAKAAQMFTLAHEFGHILRRESGLDDVPHPAPGADPSEQWCDSFAAELLVPLADLAESVQPSSDEAAEVERLARHYKVSRLVILRRMLAADLIGRGKYRALYGQFLEQYAPGNSQGSRDAAGGGDFYKTFFARNGREFAWAVVASTLAGETSYTEMTSLLGIKRLSTFDTIARELGLAT